VFLADEEAGTTRPQLILPPLDGGAYLAEHLFSIGPATAGETITYQEIKAWADLTGHVLNGWEAETLRGLSGAYLAELHAAEDAQRPPPFAPSERVQSREEVSAGLLAMFQAMAERDQKMGLAPKPEPARRVTERRRRK
jgi:hypothetical protein